jgi:hypothetical protein
MLTTARHLSLSWATLIPSTRAEYISEPYILYFPHQRHDIPSALLYVSSLTLTLYAFFPMRAKRLAHHISLK